MVPLDSDSDGDTDLQDRIYGFVGSVNETEEGSDNDELLLKMPRNSGMRCQNENISL